MKIRLATKKDFLKIADLMKEEYYKHYKEKWTIENGIKTLNYYFPISKIFVAEEKKEIIGFVIIREEHYNEGKSMMVEELVVSGKHQEKGIGKELMSFVEKYCKKQKVKRIWLITGRKANAYKFYKAIGYSDRKDTAYFEKVLR